VEADGACPAIVVHEAHGRFLPLGGVGAAVFEECHQRVVAFLEDVRAHLERSPDLALERIAPAVHQRLHALDDDRAPQIFWGGDCWGGVPWEGSPRPLWFRVAPGLA